MNRIEFSPLSTVTPIGIKHYSAQKSLLKIVYYIIAKPLDIVCF